MDLKVKHINWVGNIYQKFEAVCQEVDGIVGQDAVKYLENRVQNVGDSVKKFYCDVVQDLLPLPPLVDSAKDEAHSVALKNNIGSSVKGDSGVKDNDNNNNERVEENPDNFIESLQDSNASDLANDQHPCASVKHDLVNQVNDETYSNSLEVEDSYITQEEGGDDHSRETSGAEKENLHVSIEKVAVESAPQLMDLIYLTEKEPFQFSVCSESRSASFDSECGVLVGIKDNLDVNVEQNSCSVVEKISMNSSTHQELDFTSPGEKELFEAFLFSELSDVVNKDTCGVLTEVSHTASAVSCERPMMKMDPLCFNGCLISDSVYSESVGSYSFEIESCKNSMGDVAWSISDSSMGHVCCEPSTLVSGQIMDSQDGHFFSGCSQSMESTDELLVNSIESCLEEIQLNDDAKLEESCVFVDDSELYAVSSRAQKLRSYKKRIQDAFASKKRLAKEYEQLAIWYGDTDMEPSQSLSQSLLPFSSRTYVASKNLQVQQASEIDWELL